MFDIFKSNTDLDNIKSILDSHEYRLGRVEEDVSAILQRIEQISGELNDLKNGFQALESPTNEEYDKFCEDISERFEKVILPVNIPIQPIVRGYSFYNRLTPDERKIFNTYILVKSQRGNSHDYDYTFLAIEICKVMESVIRRKFRNSYRDYLRKIKNDNPDADAIYRKLDKHNKLSCEYLRIVEINDLFLDYAGKDREYLEKIKADCGAVNKSRNEIRHNSKICSLNMLEGLSDRIVGTQNTVKDGICYRVLDICPEEFEENTEEIYSLTRSRTSHILSKKVRPLTANYVERSPEVRKSVINAINEEGSVFISGASGAGKSEFAREVASALLTDTVELYLPESGSGYDFDDIISQLECAGNVSDANEKKNLFNDFLDGQGNMIIVHNYNQPNVQLYNLLTGHNSKIIFTTQMDSHTVEQNHNRARIVAIGTEGVNEFLKRVFLSEFDNVQKAVITKNEDCIRAIHKLISICSENTMFVKLMSVRCAKNSDYVNRILSTNDDLSSLTDKKISATKDGVQVKGKALDILSNVLTKAIEPLVYGSLEMQILWALCLENSGPVKVSDLSVWLCASESDDLVDDAINSLKSKNLIHSTYIGTASAVFIHNFLRTVITYDGENGAYLKEADRKFWIHIEKNVMAYMKKYENNPSQKELFMYVGNYFNDFDRVIYLINKYLDVDGTYRFAGSISPKSSAENSMECMLFTENGCVVGHLTHGGDFIEEFNASQQLLPENRYYSVENTTEQNGIPTSCAIAIDLGSSAWKYFDINIPDKVSDVPITILCLLSIKHGLTYINKIEVPSSVKYTCLHRSFMRIKSLILSDSCVELAVDNIHYCLGLAIENLYLGKCTKNVAWNQINTITENVIISDENKFYRKQSRKNNEGEFIVTTSDGKSLCFVSDLFKRNYGYNDYVMAFEGFDKLEFFDNIWSDKWGWTNLGDLTAFELSRLKLAIKNGTIEKYNLLILSARNNKSISELLAEVDKLAGKTIPEQRWWERYFEIKYLMRSLRKTDYWNVVLSNTTENVFVENLIDKFIDDNTPWEDTRRILKYFEGKWLPVYALYYNSGKTFKAIDKIRGDFQNAFEKIDFYESVIRNEVPKKIFGRKIKGELEEMRDKFSILENQASSVTVHRTNIVVDSLYYKDICFYYEDGDEYLFFYEIHSTEKELSIRYDDIENKLPVNILMNGNVKILLAVEFPDASFEEILPLPQK